MDEMTQEAPAQGAQQQEPYGASMLRQFHEDCSCLLMEYDSAMAPLDNPAVQQFMMDVLKTVERQFISGAEKLFKKTYKQLGPLGGDQSGQPVDGEMPQEEGQDVQVEAAPDEMPPPDEFGGEMEGMEEMPQDGGSEDKPPFDENSGKKSLRQKKDMDTMGDDPSAPSDSRTRKLPTGDEAVAGMQTKQKSILYSISPIQGGKGFRVVESYGTKSRHADLTVKGVNKYLTKFKSKSLLDGIAKGLNSGKGVKFALATKSLCGQCKCDPCGCTKSLANKKSAQAPVLKPNERVDGEALHKAMPEQEPPTQAPHEDWTNDWRSIFGDKEKEALKLSEEFLQQLTQETNFSDEHRMKSYHFHKMLEPVAVGGMKFLSGAKATPSTNRHDRAMAREVEKRRFDQEANIRDAAVGARGAQAIANTGSPPGWGTVGGLSEDEVAAQGQSSMPEDHGVHFKNCGHCSDYFKMLSREKAFGAPHREEAAWHAKNVGSLLDILCPEGRQSVGQPSAEEAAEATFAMTGEDQVGELQEKELKAIQNEAETQSKQLDSLAKLFQRA